MLPSKISFGVIGNNSSPASLRLFHSADCQFVLAPIRSIVESRRFAVRAFSVRRRSPLLQVAVESLYVRGGTELPPFFRPRSFGCVYSTRVLLRSHLVSTHMR